MMAIKKKLIKVNEIKKGILKEMVFFKNIFSNSCIPLHKKDESELDFNMDNTSVEKNKTADTDNHSRATTIAELEAKLQKVKSQNKFQIKGKLAKKSLNSKLNKKIKKTERVKNNKNKVNAIINSMNNNKVIKDEKEIKAPPVNAPKPVFNNESKLVFSKFDFAKLGEKERVQKVQKDPKRILDKLKQQEEKLQELAKTDGDKAKEMKEKLAWKSILQKAEGEKVKDDPTLLKKSIRKMEQKKKVSKNKWENRVQGVQKKKEERQTKRKENISKKKKEKKAKVVKAAVKRGRVVI